jgi:hypothetical protein
MSKTKHEKTYVNYDKAYESNIIGVRGILYFGIGLFLLIVITFGLMWFFLGVLETDRAVTDKKDENPLALSKEEALPPEPRLQSAPGFGVGTGADRTNLELREPQAEYRVLHKQWEEQWKNGQKTVGADGKETVVTLPIEEAKKKLLEQRTGDSANNKNGEEVLKESRTFISDSSAGRLPTGVRR